MNTFKMCLDSCFVLLYIIVMCCHVNDVSDVCIFFFYFIAISSSANKDRPVPI